MYKTIWLQWKKKVHSRHIKKRAWVMDEANAERKSECPLDMYQYSGRTLNRET